MIQKIQEAIYANKYGFITVCTSFHIVTTQNISEKPGRMKVITAAEIPDVENAITVVHTCRIVPSINVIIAKMQPILSSMMFLHFNNYYTNFRRANFKSQEHVK
jgi:hypothetical protein